MSYCCKCKSFKDKEHDTPYGAWAGTCSRLNVGRNPDTWSCDKFEAVEDAGDG